MTIFFSYLQFTLKRSFCSYITSKYAESGDLTENGLNMTIFAGYLERSELIRSDFCTYLLGNPGGASI